MYSNTRRNIMKKKPKVIILEGHRMTGKSTIARFLRNKVNYSTLCNLTGFPDKGIDGLAKIVKYYMNWINFLSNIDDDITIIFDRHMFSEMVYSRLYKDYSFAPFFDVLLKQLSEVADVDLIFFELNDEEELKRRSGRDKVEWNNVKEDLYELGRQRDGYSRLREELKDGPIRTHFYLVNGKSSKELANDIIQNIVK
jgi:hypothetical protein